MFNTILIVDDEIVTRTLLASYLKKNGFIVSEAQDGVEMYSLLEKKEFNLVLVDIDLPGEDGFQLTRQLRSQSDIGIIIVSSKTDSIDRIVGLEMGADDYVTKPICHRELLVRIKNLFWRLNAYRQLSQRENETIKEMHVIHFNGYSFDISRRRLKKDNRQVSLTKAEYELLLAFTVNPNKVLTRDRLLNLLTHRVDAPNDRTVDVLVRRLRNKIESVPKEPQVFITVHGEGYMFIGG